MSMSHTLGRVDIQLIARVIRTNCEVSSENYVLAIANKTKLYQYYHD